MAENVADALPLTLPFSLLVLSTPPFQECPAWELAEHRIFSLPLHTSLLVALTTEDIFIFYIVLFDMRNPLRCSTQSLLIVHVVQLLGSMS